MRVNEFLELAPIAIPHDGPTQKSEQDEEQPREMEMTVADACATEEKEADVVSTMQRMRHDVKALRKLTSKFLPASEPADEPEVRPHLENLLGRLDALKSV